MRLRVSPVTLVPQDKEGFGSVISHEENVKFIFEESRTLHSNQLSNEGFFTKMLPTKATIIKKSVILILKKTGEESACSLSIGVY
ncbi:hypothetical protein [Fictibacillus sp. FJAT-27399]|uniref:hypothetical protein n=1 Tax=Fictibacillus sp. FJAT-27399 TaxID=1729689 RepID=UPI0012E38A73|nr:hypothetical protein [Fictibacillus sp. FJAT-27399]